MVVGCLLSVLGFIFVKVLHYFTNKNLNRLSVISYRLSVVGFILSKFSTILLYVRNSIQLITHNSQLTTPN